MTLKDLVVRYATINDIETLSNLVCSTAEKLLQPHYTPEQWNNFLTYYTIDALKGKLNRQTIFVAELDGKTVGTIGLEQNAVVGLYTHLDYLHQGIASVLMVHVEKYASQNNIKQIQLTASPVGAPFYIKNGWKKIKTSIVDYDGVGFEETFMTKDLSPQE